MQRNGLLISGAAIAMAASLAPLLMQTASAIRRSPAATIPKAESGAAGEALIVASLELAKPREYFLLDELIDLELRLSNDGDAPARVRVPPDALTLVERPGVLRLTVLDSSNAHVGVPPAPAQQDASVAVTLFPRAFWGCRVIAQNLYGTLAPDVYRARLEYRADQAETKSQWLTIRVRSPNHARFVETYAQRWRDSQGGVADLRALQWLAANALAVGMPAVEAKAMLGEPKSMDSKGDAEEWRYRADRVGFIVGVESGRVASIGFSES